MSCELLPTAGEDCPSEPDHLFEDCGCGARVCVWCFAHVRAVGA